jgi:cellobiose epimerase
MDLTFYEQIKKHLVGNILPYWEKYAIDTENEGFYGAIDKANVPDARANRSIVMTARFLWTYSAASRLFNNAAYMKTAGFAFQSIRRHFFDTLNGGMYWLIQPDGTPAVPKKQVYGQAFALYALCEYSAALREVLKQEYPSTVVMDRALALYSLLERYAKDPVNGGYIEALSEDWKPTADMQLSQSDMNCAKSMNTNLHVIEAYTNLYRTLPVVYPEQQDLRKLVGISLTELVRIMLSKIVGKNHHLGLYYDMDWKRLDTEISFGHDIEASWLIWEAANELGDEPLLEDARPVCIDMARTVLTEGFDKKAGALENIIKDGKKDTTRIWWNQAEAMNGFYNSWEISGNEDFKLAYLKEWDWILQYQADRENGDWFWAVDAAGVPDAAQPKGGNWKTCYHNGRFCMELLRRSGIALR